MSKSDEFLDGITRKVSEKLLQQKNTHPTEREVKSTLFALMANENFSKETRAYLCRNVPKKIFKKLKPKNKSSSSLSSLLKLSLNEIKCGATNHHYKLIRNIPLSDL